MKKILSIFLILLFVTPCFAGTTATSSITVSTIITRAEAYLNGASDEFYTDANFIQWTNEAVWETVTRTGCLEAAPITIALVANTEFYSLGQSFLQIIAVKHNNGDTSDPLQIISLDRSDNRDMGHNDSTGRPRIYYVWNNQVGVWPIPRASEAGTNIYVFTSSLPTGVTLTSSAIETPAFFDTALVYYVVAQAHYKNRMMASGDRFLGLWEKRIEEYNALVVQRKPVE